MTQAPTDAELLELLSQLTTSEKISLLAGKNSWETQNIDRLNIPSLKVSDGPNGARGADFLDGRTAACFPACVSLAATFNRKLAWRVGVALAQETQTKGAYVLLGPTVCPHRSPLGGRNFESFSEDPLLAGELASEYVLGLQSERVGATVKHYAINEQDTRRFTVNETVSDRAMREIYLRPFEIIIKKSDPWCIMTSYPKVNGHYVDDQTTLLKDILRDEWGYKGLTMTDWGAASAAVDAGIHNGLDLEMPGPPHRRKGDVVQKLVDDGKVHLKDIDEHVLNILKLLRQTGKFTDRREPVPEYSVSRPEHERLIREAGAEGMVVLKNAGKALPLKPSSLKNIAVLGPLAKQMAAHGGGSASLNCHYKVSPFDAITSRLGDSKVSYSKGAHVFRTYPDFTLGAVNRNGNPGFICDFFKTLDMSDEAFHTSEYPRGSFMSIMNAEIDDAKAVRMTTTYIPSVSGKHYLSFSGIGPTKLFINQVFLGEIKETEEAMMFFLGAQEEKHVQYDFIAGQKYYILVESTISPVPNAELFLAEDKVAVHLGFIEQAEMETDLQSEAVELAKQADVALVFVGNTPQWETEGQDMATMSLPADGSQDKLIAEVAKVNPNTIVVIGTGVPIQLPWLDEVAAVVQTWYGGQETGNAVLDVLLGEVNPSGRLPASWPKKIEHTACYGNFGLDSWESREVEYVEGVNVGYRHFDSQYGTEKEVLFPFGFGLSYSTFEVSGTALSGTLSEADANSEVTITASVHNTGDRAGSEVVQVYLAPPQGGEDKGRPPKALVAFDKIHLGPGEKRELQLSFKRDGAAFWSEEDKLWKVEGGDHDLYVSTSSSPRDVKSTHTLNVPQTFSFGA
ncbi:Beta-glucosidase [Fusarium keratoplasticum]|uniref:Beta-glucosidase n=1 Tax=Fusarium keratoplasticum TaxID=1328300 RepID=A0ACC0QCY6_9HYPO|nr:Beta-glucosidase [Fusarium keratoplasticum]KAI8649153.1 Beta-glucosidase [Fusarium keratoplasticum]KAI8649549.1 Beta-glucosidase [Fusarium keratoplasticum]